MSCSVLIATTYAIGGYSLASNRLCAARETHSFLLRTARLLRQPLYMFGPTALLLRTRLHIVGPTALLLRSPLYICGAVRRIRVI